MIHPSSRTRRSLYQVDGRTQPGSRSSAKAWPAHRPTRSKRNASTSRSQTSSEGRAAVPFPPHRCAGSCPLLPSGRFEQPLGSGRHTHSGGRHPVGGVAIQDEQCAIRAGMSFDGALERA